MRNHAVNEVIKTGGSIHVLVNNAGITLTSYLSAYAYHAVIDVNADRELLRSMNVRSIVQFAPEWKLNKNLLNKDYPSWASHGGKHIDLTVRFYESVNINLIQQNNFVSLTDLTYELGFADQSHFIRQFKAFSGMRPREAFKKLSKPEYSAPQILQKKFKLFRFIYS